MVTRAGKMAVVRTAFLFAVSRAFARIHVEYDRLRPSPPAHFVDPPTGQINKSGNVLGPAQPLRLKAPHLARRGSRAGNSPIADDPAHRRVSAQPLGVV